MNEINNEQMTEIPAHCGLHKESIEIPLIHCGFIICESDELRADFYNNAFYYETKFKKGNFEIYKRVYQKNGEYMRTVYLTKSERNKFDFDEIHPVESFEDCVKSFEEQYRNDEIKIFKTNEKIKELEISHDIDSQNLECITKHLV